MSSLRDIGDNNNHIKKHVNSIPKEREQIKEQGKKNMNKKQKYIKLDKKH